MSPTSVVILVVVVLVILAVVAALVMASRRRALRERFGPEYDRAVAEGDSRLSAERELRDRERRHAQLELRELDPQSRERYAASWEQIQANFLDDPNSAVTEADVLVTRLIAERGYPTDNYDEQVANLSVDHARTLGNYRSAHEINLVNAKGEATTEQLRQALVHYRELFSDLLGTPRDTTSETATERTAGTDRAVATSDNDRAVATSDAERAAGADGAVETERPAAADERPLRAEPNGRAERVDHDTPNR
jgi:hypothetical protein